MGAIRIIGGRFKGQKIVVPSDHYHTTLRPSTDRVRTTLFNWLRHFQVFDRQAIAADLYCGSGILGIEALSQGIDQVVFVDQSAVRITILQRNLQRLWGQAWISEGQSKSVYYSLPTKNFIQKRTAYKGETDANFDIIFCDPPYDHTHYETLLMECGTIMKTGGILYLEAGETLREKRGYQYWQELRCQKIARSWLHLLQKQPNE